MPVLVSDWSTLALVAVVAYLLGSVPFGIVITRLMGLGDPRQIGSGNIGATNVLRTGNKPAALATLLLDAGKGGIAVLIARALVAEDAAQVAGLAAFMGHIYPIYLNFKGGKGVATFLGTLLALSWPIGLAACATWLVTAAVSRISSLSALVAASSSTFWIFFLEKTEYLILGSILTLVVFYRHADNIRRLKAGTEPKIGRKKD